LDSFKRKKSRDEGKHDDVIGTNESKMPSDNPSSDIMYWHPEIKFIKAKY